MKVRYSLALIYFIWYSLDMIVYYFIKGLFRLSVILLLMIPAVILELGGDSRLLDYSIAYERNND